MGCKAQWNYDIHVHMKRPVHFEAQPTDFRCKPQYNYCAVPIMKSDTAARKSKHLTVENSYSRAIAPKKSNSFKPRRAKHSATKFTKHEQVAQRKKNQLLQILPLRWKVTTPHDITWHHMTWHDMTSHLATNHIASPHKQPQSPLNQPHNIIPHHIAANHITTTETLPAATTRRIAEGVCTQEIRFGHRTSWWPCAHYRQILSLAYRVFSLWNFRPQLTRELLVVLV